MGITLIYRLSPSPNYLKSSQIFKFLWYWHIHTLRAISFKMASSSSVLSAAKQGDRKSIQGYITERQINVVNEEGCTPLMVAAANGRDEIIRLLLEQEVSVN